jgi:phage terminase large subunit
LNQLSIPTAKVFQPHTGAIRRLFPKVWFNASTTEAGRDALGYLRKDEQRDIGLGPEHDWSSHAADAFGLMAIAYE